MSHTLTTTLSPEMYKFLVSVQQEKKATKKSIIEEALKLYKKEKLRKEIEEGLKERQEEYREIANEFREAQMISVARYL